MPPASLTWLKAVSMPSFIWRPRSLTGPVKAAVMPNRISLSDTPRTAVAGFPRLAAGTGSVGGAAAKAGGASEGMATAGAGADGDSDCSRSASRRSAWMQSILPVETALRPSATLRSNCCARSERWASLLAASRITAANFSITDWTRGRVTSGQASAEPITGPTRPARSRTKLYLVSGSRLRGRDEKGTNEKRSPTQGYRNTHYKTLEFDVY